MSLDSYSNLKHEIIDWSHRDDLDLKIDTFIRMAEVEMFSNPQEILKVRGQEVRANATTSGKYLALPDDFMTMRSLRFLISGDESELYQRAPEQMKREPSTGRPNQFSIAAQIEFNRVPDSDYDIEMQYIAKPAALSSTNATNEVLEGNPNIYLFGALWALKQHTEELNEAANYYRMFLAAISGANKLFKKGRYGPAPQMTTEGATP